MKLAIMQPYFFPYIGYFQAIDAVDKYVLYHNLPFRKKSWINRNQILVRSGESSFITVPLIKQSSNKRISEILIDNSTPWKRSLLRKIYFNYKRAKYFDQTFPLVERVINKDLSSLCSLSIESILAVVEHLDLSTNIETQNQKYKDIEDYIKSSEGVGGVPYNGKQLEKKIVRLLEICRREKANTLINAIGGMALYRKEDFAQNGITLSFIKTDEALKYDQSQEGFSPNLSIIDVLMFNSVENTRKLLTQRILV